MTETELKQWQNRIAAARGDLTVDLLLVNGKVINVFDCSIEDKSIAIYDGYIVGFGEYEAKSTVDLSGKYISPGLIEGHIHIESSKLVPSRFADAVIPHGTTTVIADSHEIANVYGVAGIKYMLDQSEDLDLSIFYMLPSCVPATHMETAGANLTAEDLKPLLEEPRVLGIAELMNFPGAYMGDKSVLEKAALAEGNRPVDGHAPGLTGRNLYAYQIAGPGTDHECFTLSEAKEKLNCGMRIMIREGSTAQNLETLLPLVTEKTERRCLFVSDDRSSSDLVNDGHMDHILRRAVKLGLDPLIAIRQVTLNPAETFNIRDRGAIRPGWRADLTVFEDLEDFRVTDVWNRGIRLVKEGELLKVQKRNSTVVPAKSLQVPILSETDFAVSDQDAKLRVIKLIPNQIITEELITSLTASAGFLKSDTTLDIIKLLVIDRHSGQGKIGKGFVQGFDLKKGALGSTIAHDSHNIIIAGVDDRSILVAANCLIEMGGGQVVTNSDCVMSEMSLPVAGLMADISAEESAAAEHTLIRSASELGCQIDDPFMALSFLALPVIPKLKLTDRGLVDVEQFKHVSLYI